MDAEAQRDGERAFARDHWSCLCHELMLRGLTIQRQVAVPVIYKGEQVRDSLYVDILVNDLVIVEVKATEKKHPIHEVQLLTYLRLTGKKLGLLINFGREYVKNGIGRVANGLEDILCVSAPLRFISP